MNEEFKYYIAGLLDGDGSVLVDRQKSGHSLHVELAQCSRVIEPYMKAFHMKMYIDNRSNKYTNENAVKYRICGIKAKTLLEIMRDYSIIKKPQALLALDFLQYIGKRNTFDNKEEIALEISKLNNDKKAYEKDFKKLNDAYIAGLFDAEGSACISKWKIQIVQSGSPDILYKIKSHLELGTISDKEGRWRIWNSTDAYKFYERIRKYTIIKTKDLDNMVSHFDMEILTYKPFPTPIVEEITQTKKKTTIKKQVKQEIKKLETGTDEDYLAGYLELKLKFLKGRRDGQRLYVKPYTNNEKSLKILNKIIEVRENQTYVEVQENVEKMKQFLNNFSVLDTNKPPTYNYLAGLFEFHGKITNNLIKINLSKLERCEKIKREMGYGTITKSTKLWAIQAAGDIITFNETIKPLMNKDVEEIKLSKSFLSSTTNPNISSEQKFNEEFYINKIKALEEQLEYYKSVERDLAKFAGV